MTFIAALRHDRIDAPFVLDGPVNGEAFRAYVEQLLVPTLRIRRCGRPWPTHHAAPGCPGYY